MATVAINDSTNAALLAVGILSAWIPCLVDEMQEYINRMENEVMAKVERLEEVGWEEYVLKGKLKFDEVHFVIAYRRQRSKIIHMKSLSASDSSSLKVKVPRLSALSAPSLKLCMSQFHVDRRRSLLTSRMSVSYDSHYWLPTFVAKHGRPTAQTTATLFCTTKMSCVPQFVHRSFRSLNIEIDMRFVSITCQKYAHRRDQ